MVGCLVSWMVSFRSVTSPIFVAECKVIYMSQARSKNLLNECYIMNNQFHWFGVVLSSESVRSRTESLAGILIIKYFRLLLITGK